MMIQRNSPCNKGSKVSVFRDFPHAAVGDERNGIGSEDVPVITETGVTFNGYEDTECVAVADRSYHRPKEVTSVDLLMRKAGFNIAANGNLGNGNFVPPTRKTLPFFGSKVKPLSTEEAIQLMDSQSRRRNPYASIERKPLLPEAVPRQRTSPAKKKWSNAAALRLRANARLPTQRVSNQPGVIPLIRQNRITEDLSPREKVLKALRVFKLVKHALDRINAARRGESKVSANRIVFRTRDALMEGKMQVNSHKMIGSVPGIEVGDRFQYKSELNIIGLHFCIRGGIDYMKRGDMILATSIVSSEGNVYGDRFCDDVMIYCGQGGNVMSNDGNLVEDQKLVKGNLALANSMKENTPVRVIRGKKRVEDHRGKNYAYFGLYLVQEYWQEKGPRGHILFKFKLRRVSGQPYVDWKG